MRHSAVRDLEAELLREVCWDVRIEPLLLEANQNFHNSTNTTQGARLDVSAVGLWAPFERSFVDVRIFLPNAPCHIIKNLQHIYME